MCTSNLFHEIMAIYDSERGGYRIFIGDLGQRVGKTELEREFERMGPISDVWVARNPPGFGFVVFKNAEDAERAVRKLHGRTVCGRRVRVEHALKQGMSKRDSRLQSGSRFSRRSRSPSGSRARDRSRSLSRSRERRSTNDYKSRGSSGRRVSPRRRSLSRSRSPVAKRPRTPPTKRSRSVSN